MKRTLKEKLIAWMISSVLLVTVFFIGLVIPDLDFGFFLGFITIPIIIAAIYFLLDYYTKKRKIDGFRKKKIIIWIYFTLNFLFSFVMGINIPYMESEWRYNMGWVMIPLLILLNYVIVDRFYFLVKISKRGEELETEEKQKDYHSPIIEYNNKKYIFSGRSIILLAVGAVVSALLIYYFFNLQLNYWLHEIVVKQTVFFLNLIFGMGAEAGYIPGGTTVSGNVMEWFFEIPGRQSIYFETFCTGIQAICIFAGIILFTPHSKDPETNRDILWRKTKSLILSSAIFYVVNIIRMLIQIYLYYLGYPWESIHVSISVASSFIAAIIILLLHKWIPEFILSIIYAGTLIKKMLKKDKTSEESLQRLGEQNER